MSLENEIKVYFHVGTGKTGTTFLQYRVFPYLNGIYYIQRTKYKKAIKIIQAAKHSKYLVSREFDQQLEQEVKSFSRKIPETKPIIVFRRHDSYIASQYRRFVKNGFTGSFDDFFDLYNDSGYFKKDDLHYGRQIKILERYFTHKPLVLIYDDLRQDPQKFILHLVEELDISVDFQKVNFNRKHSSYSEKQLKAILALGKYINLRKRRVFRDNILHLLWRICINTIRYAALYISKLLPEAFFSKEPLIPKNKLDEVREFYREDWEQCLIYAQKTGRPVANREGSR